MQTIRAEVLQNRFLGYLENVSTTGMFVQCSIPRPVGTRFTLHIRLPGSTVLEHVEAEVIWTRGYGGRNGPAPGMGLRFVELARQPLTEIRKFCEESDPYIHPVIHAASGKSSPS